MTETKQNLRAFSNGLNGCSRTEDSLEHFSHLISVRRGEYSILEKRLGKERSALKAAEKEMEVTKEAHAILTEVMCEAQQEAVAFIASVSTKLQQQVFGTAYEVAFRSSMERGRPALTPVLLKGGMEVSPGDASGGGVLDIMSLGFRLGLWAISVDKPSNIFLLDEPGKFLDLERVPLFGEALKRMVDHLGLQVIMVTHLQSLAEMADKVWEVQQEDGISFVEEME